MTAPSWMTPEQVAAFEAGVAHAEVMAAAPTVKPDQRIALDDVVSYRCPPFLTLDYDPTWKPQVR